MVERILYEHVLVMGFGEISLNTHFSLADV